MIFSPRISTGRLAPLCHRLATALEAGIDARTIWAREAEHARGSARSRIRAISDGVERGESISRAIRQTGNYFPELFREMVDVGEQTGHAAEVFGQLADHYQHQRELRRAFLSAISWPMVQLFLAILIIGFLIGIMGAINESTGADTDPLGFGLIGTHGLMIYGAFLAAVGAAMALIVFAVRRGALWVRPIQRAALHVPMLGSSLRTIALARLAWALNLTFGTGMDVRRALAISLRAARNAKFTDDLPAIDLAIAQGATIYEAFHRQRGYPHEFLDTMAVGEESGRLVESMARLSTQYQQRARVALASLTALAGYAVWVAVAAIIIFLIFRLAMFYLGVLAGAANMR
jgi:type IV pilus assembly protein PilC